MIGFYKVLIAGQETKVSNGNVCFLWMVCYLFIGYIPGLPSFR